MKYLKYSLLSLGALVIMGCSTNASTSAAKINIQEEKAQLGRSLYFDKNLSKNRTQACSTCHNPEAGFVDDRNNGVNKQASLGDDGHSIGDRQAPSAAYAMFSPKFHYDEKKKEYIGGQFWDGREATLAGQAGGPPTNPAEMGMSSKKETVQRIQENKFYEKQFIKLYGQEIFSNPKQAYSAMASSIEAFEQTAEFAPFDSKYDRHLDGKYDLTPLEDLGKSLFFSNANNSCASCHMLKGEDKKGETFTNYEFHNIGTPANSELRAKNGVTAVDLGLLNNPAVSDIIHKGKYKVPTLRNVAITGPYMHNGVFAELRTVVEFYNKYNDKTKTINPETKKVWNDPEVKENINIDDLKAKKQNERKMEALVAFMKLLTDKRYEHLIK